MNEIRLDSASGLVAGVRWSLSPNCDERPPRCEIDVIVVHAISLPPRHYGGGFIERLFTNSLDYDEHPYFDELRELRVSSHFLVRRDGELLQFVPTHLRAWHAGLSEFQGREKVNDFSIGIEMEGCDEERFEPVQYEVLGRLVRCLMSHYPGIFSEHVVGHCDVSPGRKTDPGPCFDWERLRKEIA